MKLACANCEGPERKLWVLFGAKRKPVVSKIVDGNWVSLERCESCSQLWCLSPYEPFASFLFLAAWPHDEASWKKTHDTDAGHTLLSWHAYAIASASHSLPHEEKDAVEKYRKRTHGHNPFDNPAAFKATPLPPNKYPAQEN